MKILFYKNKIIEWTCRILFTINLLLSGLNYDDHINYPFNALAFTVIGLWLYFFNLRILSIIPLLIALFLNYMHIGVGP